VLPTASRSRRLRRRLDLLRWHIRRRPALWWSLVAALAATVALGGRAVAEPPRCPTAGSGSAAPASRVAGALPEDTRAVAIPVTGGLTVQAGDLVDVVVAGEPAVEGGTPGARTVAAAATVVDVSDEALTVAVDHAEAPEVAWQATQGTTTVVLAPPSGD